MGKKKSAYQSARAAVAGLTTAGAVAATVYTFIVRPWHLRWGAYTSELDRTYPGDEAVPEPKLTATHAITIQAPAFAIWPWLVQIGAGRGGFYSYDWIENAMGLNIQSAGKILPEYQNLKAGDVIPLEPKGGGPRVIVLEPLHALVMGGRIDSSAEGIFRLPDPNDFFQISWGFYLEPVDEDTTRLVDRFRLDWHDTLKNDIYVRAFMEPGSFIMERRMLLGIKERAEKAHQSR